MIKYPKINSIFKRDDKGKFTDEFSCPEFEYLKNNEWVATEKIDGTNIRIGYKNGDFKIGGRTEKSEIPKNLYIHLQGIVDRIRNHEFFDVEPNTEIVLFGEGYGKKIQGNPYKCDVSFIVFDIWINNWWLKREDVINISYNLNLNTIQSEIYFENLFEAIEYVKIPFPSEYGVCNAEGLVLQPKISLYDRTRSRIITKLKTKDQWSNLT